MSDTRFIVTWQPLADIAAAATQRGMKDGDGSSFWDWVATEEFEQSREFSAWQLAVMFARRMARIDVCGCAQIMKLVLRRDHDESGRFEAWDAVGMWEVERDSVGLDPASPDVTYDMEKAA